MSAIKIAEAFVEFLSKDEELTGSMDKIEKKLKGFEDHMKKSSESTFFAKMSKGFKSVEGAIAGVGALAGLAVIVGALALAVHALVEAFNKTVEAAEDFFDVIKAAKASGSTVKDILAFESAAEEAGLSAREVTSAFRSWYRMTAELIEPTSAASQAFRMLGVSALNSKGQVRGLMEVIPDLQAALQGYDRNSKMILADTLFGRAAPGMMKLLTENSRKFEEGRWKSDFMNVTITDQTSATIEDMMGSLRDLWDLVRNFFINLAELLAPFIKAVAEVLSWIVFFVNLLIKGMALVYQWVKRIVNLITFGLVGELETAEDKAGTKSLSNSEIRRLGGSGGGFGSSVGMTDALAFARNMIVSAVGSTVADAQLMELRRHTQQLAVIAAKSGSPVGN